MDKESRELLDRVRDGDEESARIFFRAYYPTVARIVRNRSSRRHTEEDLCQMIFARVFAKLDQYSGHVPIENWISRIAVNTCLSEWKKEERRIERSESDLTPNEIELIARAVDPAVSDAVAVNEAQEIVQQLLARLAPVDRLIISFLHLDQYSVEETSKLTGLPQAVVKIRAFRARRKLNKIIQPVAGKFL